MENWVQVDQCTKFQSFNVRWYMRSGNASYPTVIVFVAPSSPPSWLSSPSFLPNKYPERACHGINLSLSLFIFSSPLYSGTPSSYLSLHIPQALYILLRIPSRCHHPPTSTNIDSNKAEENGKEREQVGAGAKTSCCTGPSSRRRHCHFRQRIRTKKTTLRPSNQVWDCPPQTTNKGCRKGIK